MDALLDATVERSLQISAAHLVAAPTSGDPSDFGQDFLDGVDRLADLLRFQYHVVESRGPLGEQRLRHIHGTYRSIDRRPATAQLIQAASAPPSPRRW